MIIIIYANECDRHPGHVTPFEEKLVNAISSDILIIDVTYYTAHQNAAECSIKLNWPSQFFEVQYFLIMTAENE